MLYAVEWLIIIGAIFFLLSKQASVVVWAIIATLVTLLTTKYALLSVPIEISLSILSALLLLCSFKPLRRLLFSKYLFRKIATVMPSMSSTEREALESGTVSFEGELFSGNPNFSQLLLKPKVTLTKEEQAFLDGPTHQLCQMIDDWNITHHSLDLPQDMWTFIKEQGFFGMIIPKAFGGLEFSATAQMSILVKLYGRSITVATTIAVPNSLGPAELLLNYGTEEQKNYYLPRLASGEDIPCFALTGPDAGSDAASIPDTGVVCRQMVDGKEVLGIRLQWKKRYITLCPVATVIGLAFKLFDPDHLLGPKEELGISCALIPSTTKGIIKGRRHFPLNIAFMNGPTEGKDVFVPIDCLIGGVAMAGHGWKMLMECLSVGRAISLPSSALGGAQVAAFASGAYARVRKQFHQPIAKFEGIEEPLARIAGYTYMIDAALTMTVAAIDAGAKPAVAGAILKYHTTERCRLIALDAMDIHGGKGICLGPSNYLARGFEGSPIAITVEGANILSRSLIIFGQGAIRCHPYVLKEIESIRHQDLKAFDASIWGHVGFFLANIIKSWVFAWTDARGTSEPVVKTRRYYQLLYRYSSHLAFLADFCMITLGGELKRKEKLSARLGDLLSALYLASAVLKRFHQEGELDSDLPLVQWCSQQLLHECEAAIDGVIANFPHRWGRILLTFLLQPLGRQRRKPSDKLGQQLAKILSTQNDARKRLTRFVFAEPSALCPLGYLEEAFKKISAVEPLEKKITEAVKAGRLKTLTLFLQIDEALSQGLITKAEAKALQEAEEARQRVIAVDDFSETELKGSAFNAKKSTLPA